MSVCRLSCQRPGTPAFLRTLFQAVVRSAHSRSLGGNCKRICRIRVSLAVIYFREVQRPWLWVLLLLALAAPAIVLVASVHRALPHQPTSDRTMLAVCGSIALLVIWFSFANLIVEVRETELSIRFFLLWPERIIRWNEIRQANTITFATSGLGVRWGTGGTVYRVFGNSGVQIDLRNGETVFVGSQRAYELADAITERIPPSSDRFGAPEQFT